MSIGRGLRFWISATILLCLAGVSMCIAHSILESWKAHRFLATISNMRPGVTSEAEALKAMRGFGPGAPTTRIGEPLVARVLMQSFAIRRGCWSGGKNQQLIGLRLKKWSHD